MSNKAFNSIPKRLVEDKDGALKLEIIENYTPANPAIAEEVIEKMNGSFAGKVEALKRNLFKAK